MLLALCALPLYCQSDGGELHLEIVDPSGLAVPATVHLVSQANQYDASLNANNRGRLVVQRLPFGKYQIQIQQPGFAPVTEALSIDSTLPVTRTIHLSLPVVNQSVTVGAAGTLINPDQPGAVTQVGSSFIRQRLTSIPGRSLQDLVDSQPGWLYEGNGVLHPRGSEYQTQFVIDGIPLTDNRSPGLGPQIEADDLQSISIYTAGIPAEYGRKLGGVVVLNTIQNAQAGLHGRFAASGGSFDTASGFGQAQYSWGRNTLGGSADGSRTDHYLNPVVPQNYSNTGTIGDFSADYQRQFSASNRLFMSARHELSRFDLPNEQLQQAAGQRQTADNIETMGIASFEHIFSSHTLGGVRGMVRNNASDFNSNPQSTPIQVFQHNNFRDGYFNATITTAHGPNEWKFGVDSDSTFLHENFSYFITDPTRYDDSTPLTFAFAGQRPKLEQSAFVQDLLHHGNWTVGAGLRWDHYQLLVNRHAFEPRLSVARYFPAANMVLHFSYDRVFQTPAFENILLSSSAQIESLDPGSFLRLPVEPSAGNYYEGGVSKAFAGMIKFDVNYYRRYEQNYADDDQIDNTSISFPIAFRKAVIYGAESKIEIPAWGRFSGFASYSWQVGNVWNPVTGGLFLGDDATSAEENLTGHFPDSQDQRNTLRGRLRFRIHPRFWIAGGTQYDSGLPFEFDGDPATALAQYGSQVLGRINFARGRIFPAFQVSASAGAEVYHSDKMSVQLQADSENLTNILDVIDFGGLFSGNAIGPPRSAMLRLTTTF